MLLHGAPAFGATERYVLAVARGLADRNIEAALVYPDVSVLDPFRALRGAIALRPLEPALVTGSPLAGTPAIRRVLRELGADVVHVTDTWPAAVLAARLALVHRLLVTHHTPELPVRDNVVGRVWRRLSWIARPEVIYTSETDRKTGGSRLLRTHVVSLGIDLDRFRREPRGEITGAPVIGNVARLVAQKGQRTLIEAAPAVLARYPGARFLVVGEGELAYELRALADRMGVAGSFEFTGARDDVENLLAEFDVFAFPSQFEGLCLAVIEAQASGVPVVATPVGGICETVVPGETGLLVSPGRPAELADAIISLLDDRTSAHTLAVEAQRRVLARFSETQMVEATIALYG